MAQIGELLARIRNKKNLSLRDVEQATKIRVKYLQALEAEDYDQIPGQVYVIGFLRTYCRFLGLDADIIVNEYKEQTRLMARAEKPETVSRPVKEIHRQRYGLITLVIVLGIVIVGSLSIVGIKALNDVDDPVVSNEVLTPADSQEGEQDGPVTDNPQPGENAEKEVVTGEQQPEGEKQAVIGVNADIAVVTNNRCWLKVTADGSVIFTGTLTGPVAKQFHASKALKIIFGNAGAVRVIINGEDQGEIGKPGQVVHMEAYYDDTGGVRVLVDGEEKGSL